MTMKYNEKYGRWFTKGGLVYRYSKTQDKLVLCKQSTNYGYKLCSDSKGKLFRIHRAVYETFVGPIPDGYDIDHINTKRDDNRVENLRAVTHKENDNNPLTRQHKSESKKGNRNALTTEFGKKYIEHFGYSYIENPSQYKIENQWFHRHCKCRWE